MSKISKKTQDVFVKILPISRVPSAADTPEVVQTLDPKFATVVCKSSEELTSYLANLESQEWNVNSGEFFTEYDYCKFVDTDVLNTKYVYSKRVMIACDFELSWQRIPLEIFWEIWGRYSDTDIEFLTDGGKNTHVKDVHVEKRRCQISGEWMSHKVVRNIPVIPVDRIKKRFCTFQGDAEVLYKSDIVHFAEGINGTSKTLPCFLIEVRIYIGSEHIVDWLYEN